jgi:heme O synthase-like polyprenyltransferase
MFGKLSLAAIPYDKPIIMTAVAGSLLTVDGYTGTRCLVVAVTLNIIWLAAVFWSGSAQNLQCWGRRIFIFSLVNLGVLNVMISIDVTGPAAVLLSRAPCP